MQAPIKGALQVLFLNLYSKIYIFFFFLLFGKEDNLAPED
jgi:hypothetical protein